MVTKDESVRLNHASLGGNRKPRYVNDAAKLLTFSLQQRKQPDTEAAVSEGLQISREGVLPSCVSPELDWKMCSEVSKLTAFPFCVDSGRFSSSESEHSQQKVMAQTPFLLWTIKRFLANGLHCILRVIKRLFDHVMKTPLLQTFTGKKT
ncbi:uncharacterized protein VSU04_009510 [Chlamydotis macqueenii]